MSIEQQHVLKELSRTGTVVEAGGVPGPSWTEAAF